MFEEERTSGCSYNGYISIQRTKLHGPDQLSTLYSQVLLLDFFCFVDLRCNRPCLWSNRLAVTWWSFFIGTSTVQRTSSGALMGVVNSDTDIWTHWTPTGLAQTKTHALPRGHFHEANWKIETIDFPLCLMQLTWLCFINAYLFSPPWFVVAVTAAFNTNYFWIWPCASSI